nr:MAG TPA: hypothetical protein [Caudoviricetes sp.]DAJ53689.1 MAG TPA: hypothetical protein [Caudoviricetes sp.]
MTAIARRINPRFPPIRAISINQTYRSYITLMEVCHA